jgi:hypothetical protein
MKPKPKHQSPAEKQLGYTASGIPVVPLQTKLQYLETCIEDGKYEDALGHIDDLRDSIHLRACLRGLKRSDLTPDGLKLLRYTEPSRPS